VLEDGVITPLPVIANPEGAPVTQVELPVPLASVIIGDTGVLELLHKSVGV